MPFFIRLTVTQFYVRLCEVYKFTLDSSHKNGIAAAPYTRVTDVKS